MKSILNYLGAFLAWNLAVSAALVFAPKPLSLLLALLLSGWLLWGFVLRPEAGSLTRRWATLRIRPLHRNTLHWTLIATPVLLFLSWTLQEVYVFLVPVPPESFIPFQDIMRTPQGRLTIAVLAVGIAPILEEFVFRGLVQRSLERRWGAAWGITGAAALFAAMHLLPWIFPLHFFLGAAFGFVVYATRSIWAGVILHAANNSVALASMLEGTAAPTPTPTLWEIGVHADWWSALLALLLAGLLAGWTARRLWEAGRGTRLRFA